MVQYEAAVQQKFEEICRKNAEDLPLDLTRINSAISTFATYEDERTELFWRFFELGWRNASNL